LAAILKFLSLSSCLQRVTAAPPNVLEGCWQVAADHHHHHENERAFTAMKVDIPFVVKRRDLEETLRDLPEEVIRVKGLCRLAELPTIPMSFQHVRPQAETWFLPMLGNLGVIPTGVIIGVGLPVQDISRRFADLPSAEVNPGFKPYDL
jgi:G3E family GTPase